MNDMPKNRKVKIESIHIERDKKNNEPTLVFTDVNGVEWVHEEIPSNFGGYLTQLVHKKKSWYWQPKK